MMQSDCVGAESSEKTEVGTLKHELWQTIQARLEPEAGASKPPET